MVKGCGLIMKKCIKCGAELRDDVAFCTECGSKQPEVVICPKCKTVLPEETKFCTQCGTKIESDKDGNGNENNQHENVRLNFSNVGSAGLGNSRPKKIGMIVGMIVVILLLIGGIIHFSGDAVSEPAISVKVEDMANDYIRDQASAEKKYKGKTINITGQLQSKRQFHNAQDYGLMIFNRMAAGKNFNVIIDVDQKDVSKVNQLKIGDFISASGTCVGIVPQESPTEVSIQIQADKINE